MDFRGKVALVTGSSRGIGAAIAKALANEGAAVAINYKTDLSAASHVIDECVSFTDIKQCARVEPVALVALLLPCKMAAEQKPRQVETSTNRTMIFSS